MFSSYDRGSSRHHQVVLVECDLDEADTWVRGTRNCSHFLNSQERCIGLKSSRPVNSMNRHAVEMLRILNCVPPGYSLSCNQHIGFFEMPPRPSIPLTKATQTTDLSRKESSKNVRIQRKLDGREKHATSNVSHGMRSKQPAPTKQRSQGSSTLKTSRMLTSTCPNFITVITQSTNNTTRRSSQNRSTKINSSTMTHTLPIRSIMKGAPEIDVSLPTRDKRKRIECTIDYTYYLNRYYSEATSMYKNYHNKIEVCTPIVQPNYRFLNRVKFIANYLEGTIALPMHQITTMNAKIGIARFRPVISNVQASKLYRAIKHASPIPKTTPAPSLVHKPPCVPNFSLVYIESVDSYLVQKERPSFKGDHKSASLRQTPITPRISRHHTEYYISPTPVGESILHSQQVWTSMVSNQVSPASQKLEITSSEVQTTPDLLDTLTVESRTREDRSKRHSGSIFSLIQRRLHKLGPKSGRHK